MLGKYFLVLGNELRYSGIPSGNREFPSGAQETLLALRLPSQVLSSQTEERSQLKSNMYVYMWARGIPIGLRLPSQVLLSSQTEV